MRRYEVERAVLGARLPAPQVAIMLALLTRQYGAEDAIPEGRQPSITQLALDTGLDRSTVVRHLPRLERLGWLVIKRPAVWEARTLHRTSAYSPTVPGGYPQAGRSQRPGLGAASDQAGGAVPPGLGAPGDQAGRTAPHVLEDEREGDHRQSDDDLTRIAVTELAVMTGRAITEATAAEAVRQVLDGRTVRNPAAYLRRALRANPERWAPASSLPPRVADLGPDGRVKS
jgi:hypothetical protein